MTSLPPISAAEAVPSCFQKLGAHCVSEREFDARTFSILVIDENAEDLKLLRLALKWTRFTVDLSVHFTADCETTLKHLLHPDAVLPSLIVLDLERSGKPCLKALKVLKQNARTCSIPVIGWARPENKILTDVYREQANCVVKKPGTVEEAEEFLHRIERFWFSTATLTAAATHV
jgi:CheY-like chemotaxis protein